MLIGRKNDKNRGDDRSRVEDVGVISQGGEGIRRKNIWIAMQSIKMGKNKKGPDEQIVLMQTNGQK